MSRAEDRLLVWNFFFKGQVTDGQHLLPPPKELKADERGELYLASFSGFDSRVSRTRDADELLPLEPLFGIDTAVSEVDDGVARFGTDSGFETFLLEGRHRDFRLHGELHMDGAGKIGLVLRIDENGDGYYLKSAAEGGAVQRVSAGAHLDEHQGVVAVARDHVELAARAAIVALDDRVAALAQKGRSAVFTAAALRVGRSGRCASVVTRWRR